MADVESLLETPFGSFDLACVPDESHTTALRAWNAADRLLLDALAKDAVQGAHLLTVNDTCGALSLPLQAQAVWTDSAIACQNLAYNAARNQQPLPHIIESTEAPQHIDQPLTTVALKIPKQLAFFEYQLNRLAIHLPVGATLYCAGMDKHLSPHTATLLEKHFGPTTRHHGKHKARVFTAQLNNTQRDTLDDEAEYFCEPLAASLCSLPNVFSRDKLDAGARLLLGSLEALEPADSVIDLACGNGVLGLYAARHQQAESIAFCDESAQALASARRNAARLLPQDQPRCTFHWGDGLLTYSGQKVDRIFINPPFHAGHTVDENVGKRLLSQCAAHLKSGGDLILVANRHLNYRSTLRGDFSGVSLIARNKKFVILRAVL